MYMMPLFSFNGCKKYEFWLHCNWAEKLLHLVKANVRFPRNRTRNDFLNSLLEPDTVMFFSLARVVEISETNDNEKSTKIYVLMNLKKMDCFIRFFEASRPTMLASLPKIVSYYFFYH